MATVAVNAEKLYDAAAKLAQRAASNGNTSNVIRCAYAAAALATAAQGQSFAAGYSDARS